MKSIGVGERWQHTVWNDPDSESFDVCLKDGISLESPAADIGISGSSSSPSSSFPSSWFK